MMTKSHILVLAALLSIAPLVSVSPPSMAAGNPAVCDGFARDYARRNSRGPIAGGVTFGAIGGAIVGGILGGPPGAAGRGVVPQNYGMLSHRSATDAAAGCRVHDL